IVGNVNYQTILALLLRKYAKNSEPAHYEWVSREYLFKQFSSYYVPIRTKKEKPGVLPAAPAPVRKGRKPAAELTHGTFSDFMRALLDGGFITQRESEDEKRQKVYRITETGEITFRFHADPATNTLVRTVLDQA
ncbi:MAG: hypothetical protein LUQ71_08190, partial [Methanoregula sp.]|nr:hypothetical protein [Methanoregula sp.]